MPSVRVLLKRADYNRLDSTTRDEIADRLHRLVTRHLGKEGVPLSDENVEVLWFVFEEEKNAIDILVEILFSVNDDFRPTSEQQGQLANVIQDWLISTAWLMNRNFRTVGTWVRPQIGAIFHSASRVD
ncbi:hypothetical protein KJ596_03515 [Patescibacteria group bacterium]|nr:hypothetical protein [Patescibacteria group bacterium]MBU1868513.1 hypothetical protein [Patescibacteria group bacterium]